MQKHWLTWLTIVALSGAGLRTGWAQEAAKAAKPVSAAKAKAVTGLLMSGDPQQIQEAVATVRQILAENPATTTTLLAKWNAPLFFAKRYDDAAEFAQLGILRTPGIEWNVETLQRMRVRALILGGRTDEAVAAAKSLYNVATMRNTSIAIDLVVEALDAAHKGDATVGKRFRLQQMESAKTNAPASTATEKTISPLADVKVDPKPYTQAIQHLLDVGDLGPAQMRSLGNLYLLADQPQKAEKIYRLFYDTAGQAADLALAIEGVARSLRAQDGNIARANAYILEQRAKRK